jgi:ADP-L-glycero-D-manno-heptose 6-epimerase
MILITGSAGFIASCLITKLNNEGFHNLVLVDDFSNPEKKRNYQGKEFKTIVDRRVLKTWIKKNHSKIDFIFHLGARTDTTEFNKVIFDELNLNYSKELWNLCSEHNIPLVYASSAATYGLGEFGYIDDHNLSEKLKPLNPYGESKNDFDVWVLKQVKTPPFWYGLKFFNVFGPNEYHKGRMASVIFHSFNQIQDKGIVKLFSSHNPDFKDGEQLRDFVYVKDVINVCYFLMENTPNSGIYNLGSGKARTFLDLVKNTFLSLNQEPNIEFIDTPIEIRDKYQYFTEADMSKLLSVGYNTPFYTLEEGVKDYVQNYLIGKHYF